jgi:uncharacterized protein DUF6894
MLAMPRFFFDVQEHGLTATDVEGSELPDAEAACREAAITLGEMVRDTLKNSPDSHSIRMVVRDERGTTLCHMSLSFDDGCQGSRLSP